MKNGLARLAVICAALWVVSSAWAVEPKEMLKDPVLENRARDVSKQLRCVQCQNETIDESHAEIARDMRILVRERITAGDSNEQIVSYMVSRYGEYVRLSPRFAGNTLLLWLGPVLILIVGGFVVASRLKHRGNTAPPLTPEEQAALAALTDSGDKTS
jgi:cytochrome c-type biogenesis protein CcmH